MAVLQAGAIKIDLEANTKNLINGFKNALLGLTDFGKGAEKTTSQSKRLDDQLKALERRKELLTGRMKILEGAGKTNTAMYKGLGVQVENLNDRIATQNIRIGEYGNKVKQQPSLLAGFANSLANVGKVGQNAMSNLFSSINRVAEIALGNILANGFTKATSEMLRFARASFGLTVNLQDVRGGFEAMLGSADKAKKLLEDLSKYNKKTPFTLPQLQEQAANLLAVGVSAEKIIPTLDVLGKISRGNANRLGFLTLAYGQVQSATKLTGAELRQFTENGVPLLELLAEQTGKSTAQIKEAITDGAVSFEMVDKALNSTIQEGGRFYNYFEKQNKNFSFVSSNIIDNFQEIGRSILGITEQGDVIEGGIFEKIINQAQRLLIYLDKNKLAIIDLGQDVVNFGIGTINILKKIPSFFDDLKEKLKELTEFVINTTEVVAQYFKPELEVLKQIFAIFTNQILPFIVASLAVLGGLLVWLGANVLTALSYAWEQLREPVMQFALAMMELSAIIAPIITAIFGFIGVLLSVLVPVLQIVFAAVVLVFKGILMMITGTINYIVGIIKVFVGTIGGIFTGDFSLVAEGFKQIWEGLAGFLWGMVILLVSPVGGIVDGIENTFKSIDLIKTGKDAIQGFINGMMSMTNELKQKVEGLANTVTNGIKNALQINSPSKVTTLLGQQTGQGLQVGLKNSKNNIQAEVMAISDIMIQGLSSNNKNISTINQSNNFNISASQPQAIVNEVIRVLAKMNNLANSGVGQSI